MVQPLPINGCLIHWGRVTHICGGNIDQHCFRKWLVACSAPSHYLNQCWNIVNWTLRNKPLQWHHNGRDGVSNHQRHVCLLNRIFKHRSKKISKLRATGLSAGIHQWPVNSPHKGPVTRKMFQFDDVIMVSEIVLKISTFSVKKCIWTYALVAATPYLCYSLWFMLY